MRLSLAPETLAVCRLMPEEKVPDWTWQRQTLLSITYTDDELSIVCQQRSVPPEISCEKGWRALKVEGPLDFALTGILASLVAPLARGAIPVFALSTFDTDYILLKELHLSRAQALLEQEGHTFLENDLA